MCAGWDLSAAAAPGLLSPPDGLTHHAAFAECSRSGRRPADMVCATCGLPFSRAEARLHWEEAREKGGTPHRVFVRRDMCVWERVWYDFELGGFTEEGTDCCNDYILALWQSRSTYAPSAFTQKDTGGMDLPPEVGVACVHASMQGWRSAQEDAHCCSVKEGVGVFGVFDGHGGTVVSEWLGQHFIAQLDAAGAIGAPLDEVGGRLQQAFVDADEALRKEFHGRYASGDCGTMGSCAVACVVTPTHIICANAGDSRAVLARDGGCVALSQDHCVDDEAEAKRIAAAGCDIIDGRVDGMLNVPRALGDWEFKRAAALPAREQAVTAWPDVTVTPRGAGDEFVVLACDGVWDGASGYDGEATCRFLRRQAADAAGGAAERWDAAAQALLDANLAPPDKEDDDVGTDNMTVLIVLLRDLAGGAGDAGPATPRQSPTGRSRRGRALTTTSRPGPAGPAAASGASGAE